MLIIGPMLWSHPGLPSELVIDAWSLEDVEGSRSVQGISHRTKPQWGVQFHPEVCLYLTQCTIRDTDDNFILVHLINMRLANPLIVHTQSPRTLLPPSDLSSPRSIAYHMFNFGSSSPLQVKHVACSAW